MNLRAAVTTLLHVAYDLVMKLNPRKLAAAMVITDDAGRVLALRSRYVGDVWSLPGGGVNRGENLDEAAVRECREELGVEAVVERMTGMYYHANVASYVAVFRGRIVSGEIRLSHEHAEYRWLPPADLPEPLRQSVADALSGAGETVLRSFR